MGAGYVGILAIDVHLPDVHSLKAKRHELSVLRTDLTRRFGAAVAEVDHHDLWQRALVTAVLVDRRASEVERRLGDVEDYLAGRWDGARVDHRAVVAPEDLDG